MKAELQNAMKAAMKERDKVKVETIRSLLSAIQYEEIQKKVDDLPDDAALAILQRELKKRKEELEFAEKAQRSELIERIHQESQVIEHFMPKQLSTDELERAIVDIKSRSNNPNVGAIMKGLQEAYGGQYDGKLASELARKVLSA